MDKQTKKERKKLIKKIIIIIVCILLVGSAGIAGIVLGQQGTRTSASTVNNEFALRQ